MSLLAFPAVLRAAETFSDSTAPQQQQPKTRILSGTVLDAVTNEPVIGAAVQVRGRQGGEITAHVQNPVFEKLKKLSYLS